MQTQLASAVPQIDRDYVLGAVLGCGGMGVVYSAIQRSLGRRVAIKIPHPELAGDAGVCRRFRAEARAGGRLEHRNIARVIDFGGGDGALYLVMEYVGGTPLDKMVLDQGPLAIGVAVEICGQLLAALGEAHGAGISHADIKSANVLVEKLADGTFRAVVIDFGLARFSDDRSVHDTHVLSGTPEYLAPELIRGGPPTVASDIYSAGIVLYELLTGRTPFGGGTSQQVLLRHLDDAVVLPSLRCPEQGIPPALEDVVMRAVAKDPGARFATTALFGAALRAAGATSVREQPLVLARGTQSVFSIETTTRDWQRGAVNRPAVLPASRATDVNSRIQQRRVVVGEALAGGNGDLIVTTYLELVRTLIDDHQIATAVGELERGLAILRVGVSAKTPPAMWRLQLCLAALYSGLGEPMRARCAAMVGQDDAIRAASTLGEDRAHALLVKLARHRTSSAIA